jgi:ankyrin repeat protein
MGFWNKLFSPVSTSPTAEPRVAKNITKTDIKLLFRSIRNGDQQKVRELIQSNQEFINACASAPPKKDDGQSPLQVAIKSGQFDIADYLIDQGANVNFMEESRINSWHAPVLHDAIVAAVGRAGRSQSWRALAILKRLLERGAKPNALDSYGTSCLNRAIHDARPLIHSGLPSEADFLADLGKVFEALLAAGADIHAKSTPQGTSAFQEAQGSFLDRFIR